MINFVNCVFHEFIQNVHNILKVASMFVCHFADVGPVEDVHHGRNMGSQTADPKVVAVANAADADAISRLGTKKNWKQGLFMGFSWASAPKITMPQITFCPKDHDAPKITMPQRT